MDIQKDNQMYMQVAMLAAQRSYAKRLKVGCVIVKNNSIILSVGTVCRQVTTIAVRWKWTVS